MPSQAKLAVLIDADNAQPKLAEALLAEIAKYGVARSLGGRNVIL